jgi:hypothetical protein
MNLMKRKCSKLLARDASNVLSLAQADKPSQAARFEARPSRDYRAGLAPALASEKMQARPWLAMTKQR